MSQTDPSTHPWGRRAVRHTVTWVGAILAVLAMVPGGAAFGALFGSVTRWSSWLSPVFVTIGLLLLIGVVLLQVVAEDGHQEMSEFGMRASLLPPLCAVGAFGLGWLLFSTFDRQWPSPGALILLAAGVVGVVVAERRIRATRVNRVIAARLRAGGTLTTGAVTRAAVALTEGGEVTIVTVRFVDSEGTPRWTIGRVGGAVSVGDAARVRYLQEHVERRAGVLVFPI